MLDPRFFQGRWKATAVAKTTVVVVHMTREGLEAFLQQNPLAQVHLRASMARARAEIVKLEALEKIAAAHQAQLQRKARRRRARLPPLAAGGAPAAGPAAAAAGAAGAAPSATLQGLRLPAATGTAAEQAVSAAAAEEAGGESAADGGDEGEEEDPQRDTLLSAGVSSATLELFRWACGRAVLCGGRRVSVAGACWMLAWMSMYRLLPASCACPSRLVPPSPLHGLLPTFFAQRGDENAGGAERDNVGAAGGQGTAGGGGTGGGATAQRWQRYGACLQHTLASTLQTLKRLDFQVQMTYKFFLLFFIMLCYCFLLIFRPLLCAYCLAALAAVVPTRPFMVPFMLPTLLPEAGVTVC